MASTTESLLISVAQANIKWEQKSANLNMFEQMIKGSEGRKEIVLLPEMFSTGFVMQPEALVETMQGETIKWMKRVAAENRIILAGSVIIGEGGKFFNRLIWMRPDGEYGYYDKRHLFGYAGEDERYTAGNKRLIASAKGWKLNLLVCYDLRFPVWSRQSVPVEPLAGGGFIKKDNPRNSPEYDVLVYVANWPEKRAHAWKTLLQARAIENQCYVVGVNRVGKDGNDLQFNGDSMVVDPMGEIVQSVSGNESFFTCELSYSKLTSVREKLPFLKDADPFIIAS